MNNRKGIFRISKHILDFCYRRYSTNNNESACSALKFDKDKDNKLNDLDKILRWTTVNIKNIVRENLCINFMNGNP